MNMHPIQAQGDASNHQRMREPLRVPASCRETSACLTMIATDPAVYRTHRALLERGRAFAMNTAGHSTPPVDGHTTRPWCLLTGMPYR